MFLPTSFDPYLSISEFAPLIDIFNLEMVRQIS